jgi:hypothetical protein
MATKPSDNPIDNPTPPKPTVLPADPPPKVTKVPSIGSPGPDDRGDYRGTGLTADELVAKFGTNPDGSPRTEPVPDTPNCPVVSLSDGPFDTTTIPPGCSDPLTAECADYYNAQIAANTKAQKG